MIIFHLSNLWKAKFFILCDVIFLVRLQGKFEIDQCLLRVKGFTKRNRRELLSYRAITGQALKERQLQLFFSWYNNILIVSRAISLSFPSSKTTFSQHFKEKCISDVVRIGSTIIFHLSKLWKAKFFILCDVIFLVRLQGKFEIDHSWEWKG